MNTRDKVISFALAAGLGDRQSEACGFAHKGDFGKLSSLAVSEFRWVAGFVEKEWFGQNGPQNTKSAALGRAL